MYLSYLIHAQTRQSESHAPRLLHSLLASLSAGSTYLEALRQAQATISDRWIREDLGLVIQKFLLDSPLESGLREVRKRVHSRNLGIIWDSLAVCCANRVPPRVAHSLLSEVASTVQFNVELASEVEARSAGQRTQVLLLAVIVPGLYLYLRWLSPDLLDGLDQSALGRYFLLPAAALLEAAGLYLSFRFSRVAP
jgi:Flp pilus assembly protein TadB